MVIFFDLGNVLLFFDHGKMWRQVSHLFGQPEESFTRHLIGYADLYERGGISTSQLHEELCATTGQSPPLNDLKRALSEIFTPNEEMTPIVEQLKAKGHSLFILSNTCDAHFEFAYENYPFLKLFDGYVLSYEARARKPEREIFEYACQKAGCLPHECFYTDDIPEYIVAARALQIDAELFINSAQLTQQLSIRGIL